MSKAERHEGPGYFGRAVIRLEWLKDRIKKRGVAEEEVRKLIWSKMKKLECHVKFLNWSL
jgi:hypothetical protein